ERRYDLDEVPPPMAILRDAFRSKKSRRYRLPSLPDTLFKASFITAMARQKTMRGDVDLLFRPMLRGVSMLDWKKYDQVVEETHKRALAQLTGMDAETAKGLGVTV
ncbi:MAG: patatin, partial [Pseudomonadota bacterium]